jgi:hypothetical protein
LDSEGEGRGGRLEFVEYHRGALGGGEGETGGRRPSDQPVYESLEERLSLGGVPSPCKHRQVVRIERDLDGWEAEACDYDK